MVSNANFATAALGSLVRITMSSRFSFNAASSSLNSTWIDAITHSRET